MTIPMVFILLTIVFVVIRIMPGDPVSAMMGGRAPRSVIEEKKQELGLNRPLAIQYVDYLWDICRMDLGESMFLEHRVTSAIAEKLPATLELSLAGMSIALLLGIFGGGYAADKRRSIQDYMLRFYSIVIYCIPSYWLGLMLQLIFGTWLGILPIAGRTGRTVFASTFERTGFYTLDTILIRDCSALGDVLLHLVLPSLTLGLVMSGVFLRLTRANMLDVLRSDYVQAAEARGIRHRKVIYKHALKNAFIPILTMIGLQFAQLLCNALLTETTFSWPGLGRLLMESIYMRDYATIQGTIVIYALLVATISLIVDIIYAVVDPRIRY